MPFSISLSFLWLIIAVILSIVEMNTSALVSIWFVVGSVFAFGVSFITSNIFMQLLVFIIVSGLCILISRPLATKMLSRQRTPTNVDRIVGKKGIVEEMIKPDEKGRVKIDGLSWLAQSNEYIDKGEQIIVKEIIGVTLIVESVKNKVSN